MQWTLWAKLLTRRASRKKMTSHGSLLSGYIRSRQRCKTKRMTGTFHDERAVNWNFSGSSLAKVDRLIVTRAKFYLPPGIYGLKPFFYSNWCYAQPAPFIFQMGRHVVSSFLHYWYNQSIHKRQTFFPLSFSAPQSNNRRSNMNMKIKRFKKQWRYKYSKGTENRNEKEEIDSGDRDSQNPTEMEIGRQKLAENLGNKKNSFCLQSRVNEWGFPTMSFQVAYFVDWYALCENPWT